MTFTSTLQPSRNLPKVVITPLTQNMRTLPMSILLVVLMLTSTTTTMVASFTTPFDAHISKSAPRSNTVGLTQRRLQQRPLRPVLNSTPTEETDATNNPTPSVPSVTTTSKSAETVHFLKPDFIDAIHKKTGMTKKESENLYKIFFDVMTEQLLESANTDPASKIKIPKFGTFFIKLRPERIGKNPRTGEPITIAASKIPSFTPASTLKDLMNGKVKSSNSKTKSGDDDDDDEDE